jgi:hypothetical protein
VVSLFATQEKADYASETVALPSRSSDCAERYRQCITLATILGELAVAQWDPVPEHLFGCAVASLAGRDQTGSPYKHVVMARRANRLGSNKQ